MNNLKIAVVPLDIVWSDIEENLYITNKLLKKLDKDTDIAVLPELFTTGFIATADLLHKYAEDSSSSGTLETLKDWSRKFNFAIAGSYLVREGEKIINRGFFIEPSGEHTFYDKTHLFRLSAEYKEFSAGSKHIPVIRFRGWNIAIAICYELRFPVWLRNTDNKYDVLIIPSNWPACRAYAWEHLLIARAIENQAYVVGANRSGKDDSGDYDELSFIFDYLGKPVHKLISKTNGCVMATLDRENLYKFRSHFPVAEDADKFSFIN